MCVMQPKLREKCMAYLSRKKEMVKIRKDINKKENK